MDLQILRRPSGAKTWTTIFDAQKVDEHVRFGQDDSNAPIVKRPASGSSPVLGIPDEYESIPQIELARFPTEPGPAVAFTTYESSGAGSGYGALVIVLLSRSGATVLYEWTGQGSARIVSTPSERNPLLSVVAPFWTSVDGDCCPVRDYHFAIGATAQGVVTTSDDRPFLGVYLKAVSPLRNSSGARIVAIVSGSPASGILHVGDTLLGVVGSDYSAPLLGPAVIDELEGKSAGSEILLRIRRGGNVRTVRVRLSSMASRSARGARPWPAYTVAAL